MWVVRPHACLVPKVSSVTQSRLQTHLCQANVQKGSTVHPTQQLLQIRLAQLTYLTRSIPVPLALTWTSLVKPLLVIVLNVRPVLPAKQWVFQLTLLMRQSQLIISAQLVSSVFWAQVLPIRLLLIHPEIGDLALKARTVPKEPQFLSLAQLENSQIRSAQSASTTVWNVLQATFVLSHLRAVLQLQSKRLRPAISPATRLIVTHLASHLPAPIARLALSKSLDVQLASTRTQTTKAAVWSALQVRTACWALKQLAQLATFALDF